MNATRSCSELSLTAGESLAGTATQGSDWLLVEARGAWGRDAIEDSGLPAAVRDGLGAYPGKVILIRRPDRRTGNAVIRAIVREGGGIATRVDLATIEHVATSDLQRGDVLAAPLFLVCMHGRRDACCARLGAPLFEAVGRHLAAEQLWQASHLGGHRFAPNVVVLPHGIQLGRIPPDRAEEIVDSVSRGRIPLDLYRGRTIYSPLVQAAEVAIRRAAGLEALDALTLVSEEDDRATFTTPSGEVTARVEQREGNAAPASCGAEPEPTVAWATSLESAP